MRLNNRYMARGLFAAALVACSAVALTPSAAEQVSQSLQHAALMVAGVDPASISPSAGVRGLLLSPSRTHDSAGTPLQDVSFSQSPAGTADTSVAGMSFNPYAAGSSGAGPGVAVTSNVTGKALVSIETSANFVPSTSLSVNLTVEVSNSFQQNLAHVSVHSPPGETAVMTCGISSVNTPGTSQDCSGNSKVASRALLSRQGGNNVTLTYDLRGDNTHDKSISIEVSYI